MSGSTSTSATRPLDVLPRVPPGGDGGGPAAAAPRPARGGPAWGPVDQGLLSAFIVVVVLGQRVGIPLAGTQISIALPAAYLLAAVLLFRRRVVVDRLRTELYVLVALACLGTTALHAFAGDAFSTPSLLLLLSLYLLFVVRIRGGHGQAAVLRAGNTFVRLMLVIAALGVFQLAGQLTGVWSYQDYVAGWVPGDLLVRFYNTNIPLEFGSPTFKANGFVLLEPSFLSQFCALAVIIGLVLHVRAWQLLLLIAGMASAVSGTGFILLVVGVLFLVLRAPRQVRARYVLTGGVALGLVLLSPAADLLLQRTSEVSVPGSSGYARFVSPFTEVLEGLADEPARYLLGAGPGTAERLLESARTGSGEVVLYSLVPKAVFEYGLLAAGLLVLFLLVSTLAGSPWRVVPASLLVMTFALSGALLQPQTATLVWVFTTLGAVDLARWRRERASSRGFAIPERAR